MLELVDPQPGDRVYDPCFGFGELLVGAARRLREAARTAPPRVWAGVRQAGIFGIEISRLSYAVGLCRILLAGIERPGLELSDALGRPLPRSRSGDGFDCIMAVPPWGMRVSRTPAVEFPFPNRQSETPVPATRDGEPASRRTRCRRTAGSTALPTWSRSTDEEGSAVGLQCGCRGIAAGRCVRALDRNSVNLVVFRRDEPRSAVRFISIPPDTWKAAPEVRDDYIPRGRDRDSRGLGIGVDGLRDGGEFGGIADADAGLVVGGGVGGGSGSSAGGDDGSGFGGGIGAGAGFSDGSGFGGGYGSGAGLGNGGGYGDGTGSDAGFEDGSGIGHEAGLNAESDDGRGGWRRRNSFGGAV